MWSNVESSFNFDCRNGFLGVNYIGLDISHSKIDVFCWGGGTISWLQKVAVHPSGEEKKIGILKIITTGACMSKITVLAPVRFMYLVKGGGHKLQNVAVHPSGHNTPQGE